jgi:hypothetical protein
MTAHQWRLPFSLDPLIAEAQRRARQRRLLVASTVIAVAGVATAFALQPSSGPSSSAAAALGRAGFVQVPGMTLVAFHRASAVCNPPPGITRFLAAYCVHLVPPEAGGLDQVWALTAAVKQYGIKFLPIPVSPKELRTPVHGPTTVMFQVRKFPRRPGPYGTRALALSAAYTGFSGSRRFYRSHPGWAVNGGKAGEFLGNGSSPIRYAFAWVANRSVVWMLVIGGSPAEAQQIAHLAGPA